MRGSPTWTHGCRSANSYTVTESMTEPSTGDHRVHQQTNLAFEANFGGLAFVRDHLMLLDLFVVEFQGHSEHDLAGDRVAHEEDAKSDQQAGGNPQVAQTPVLA